MSPTDPAPSTRTARCLCGTVRIQLDGAALWTAHCHCDNCRRAHGAGVVTWVGYPVAARTVHSGADRLSSYRTETGATRSFCGVCGSPLTYESDRWPGEVHVAVASLDDCSGLAPRGHAYADRAPHWCPIQDDLPCYGGESGIEPLA